MREGGEVRPAAHLIWEAAGSPPPPKPLKAADAPCCVCAEWCEEGVTTRDAFGANFTDHNMLQAVDSPFVCPACSWAISGKPPHTLRMWSIVCRTDRELAPSHEKCALDLGPHVHLTARNDTREIVSILLAPPDTEWICTLAISGQKHVVPYAVANIGPRWRIRMETLDIHGDSESFAHVLFHTASLRALGFTAEEIATAEPAIHRLTRETIPLWQHHMGKLAPYHGGGMLDLALTCITKDRIDEYREQARSALIGYGACLDDAPLPLRAGSEEAVGSHEVGSRSGSEPGRGARRVHLDDGPKAGAPRPEQRSMQLHLFDA